VLATLSASSTTVVLVGAVFLASAVEMVEALTIVLAVGYVRGWKSALQGVVVALLALAALVGAFGPALVHVPLSALRLVVGSILLIFGMQWLRKALLRSSGLKAKHDEDAIYRATVAELEARGEASARDQVAFVVAFKGVFLEGMEIVITVLTLGTSAHRLGLAVIVAVVAIVIVGVVGLIVAKQLSSVPENAMKMTVGVMLVSYGTFWAGEGLHVRWPGGDTTLLALVVLYALAAAVSLRVLRVTRDVAEDLAHE
jgi:uncharacterized membrane protein